MSSHEFDYFVIGAGSGGTRSARIAAGHGARVGVAEEWHLGGTCVNVGCVPKKLMVYAGSFALNFEDAAGYGWDVGGRSHNWQTLIANKDREITRLNGIYRRLLENAGAQIFETRARLADAHTVVMGDKSVTADNILIATGGEPSLPPIPGVAEHAITSNEVFFLTEMPKRIAIVGGGFIALEFAGIFSRLGAETHLIHRRNRLLAEFDEDIGLSIGKALESSAVQTHIPETVTSVERGTDGLKVALAGGQTLTVDCLMFATGRTPNTKDLGLEAAGVAMDAKGAVIVDDAYRTSAENVYAVGDVISRVTLTPVAIAEGHSVADALFSGHPRDVHYPTIPSAVFSDPPGAGVGLTEAEARERGHTVDIYRSEFTPMMHTLTGREEKVMMKLVVDAQSDRVLGCHMVGRDAPEIIQGLAVALTAGATKAQFDRTIGLHPTTAEEFVTMRTKVDTPPGTKAEPPPLANAVPDQLID